MDTYIYGLIDPSTRLVRYVGRTADLKQRYKSHCSGCNKATGAWVRSLLQSPILVILEVVRHGADSIDEGTLAETKWIKRFRRTVLNAKRRANNEAAWDWLVNPETPLPSQRKE